MEFKMKASNCDERFDFTLDLSEIKKFDVYYLDSKVKFNDKVITFNRLCDKLANFNNIYVKDSDNFFSDCIDDDAIYEKWDKLCDICSELEDLAHNTELLMDSFKQFKVVFFDTHTIDIEELEYNTKANVLWTIYYAIHEIDLPDGY